MVVALSTMIDDKPVCLLYTSDAADERSSVDLGGRRIIKKKKRVTRTTTADVKRQTDASADDDRTMILDQPEGG
mgnify:CR=1 FL=1